MTDAGSPGAAGLAPWWRGAVLYQVYPLSFADADGDGWGDLAGLLDRLDHIAGLGVDAVWLSPVFPSPLDDFGYDVADFCDIDPRFGDLATMDRLIAAAHDRGLKVLLDLVLCHTSDRHPWFAESRRDRANGRADWYVWADPKPDGTPPNNWQAVFGGPSWSWEGRRQQYYLHHFLTSQPALNWHNPAVERAVFAAAGFWLDRGVDGFRLDAISRLLADPALRDNPPAERRDLEHFAGVRVSPYSYQHHLYDRAHPEMPAILERLRAHVDRWPERFLLGEVADADSLAATARYLAPGRLHSCYTFQLTEPRLDAGWLAERLQRNDAELGPDGWLTHAVSNHDWTRAVSRYGALAHLSGDDPALAKLLIALLTSLRGTVCLYQGDELGLPQADVPFERLADPFGRAFWPDYPGRDGARTPMPWRADAPQAGFTAGEPWLPVDPAHARRAIDRQAAAADSVLAFTRRWLAWRRSQPALVSGSQRIADPQGSILAVERAAADQHLTALFNLSNERARWTFAEPAMASSAPHPVVTWPHPTGALTLPAFGFAVAAATTTHRPPPGNGLGIHAMD